MDKSKRRALYKAAISFSAFELATILTGDNKVGAVAAALFSSLDDTIVPPFDEFASKYLRPARVWLAQKEPLFERLNKTSSPDELKALLASFRRRSKTTTEFENNLRAVGHEYGDARLQEITDMLLDLVLCNLGSKDEWIHVASAVLTRFATSFDNSIKLRSFYDVVEGKIDYIDAACVPTIECLAYIGMVQDKPGMYINNVRRYINDPRWLKTDAAEGDEYYGSEVASLEAIVFHYKHRPIQLHVHDLARVIHLYGLYRDQPETSGTAIRAKEGMLDAISAHDEFGSKLRGQVEDMMEKRRRNLRPGWHVFD